MSARDPRDATLIGRPNPVNRCGHSKLLQVGNLYPASPPLRQLCRGNRLVQYYRFWPSALDHIRIVSIYRAIYLRDKKGMFESVDRGADVFVRLHLRAHCGASRWHVFLEAIVQATGSDAIPWCCGNCSPSVASISWYGRKDEDIPCAHGASRRDTRFSQAMVIRCWSYTRDLGCARKGRSKRPCPPSGIPCAGITGRWYFILPHVRRCSVIREFRLYCSDHSGSAFHVRPGVTDTEPPPPPSPLSYPPPPPCLLAPSPLADAAKRHLSSPSSPLLFDTPNLSPSIILSPAVWSLAVLRRGALYESIRCRRCVRIKIISMERARHVE